VVSGVHFSAERSQFCVTALFSAGTGAGADAGDVKNNRGVGSVGLYWIVLDVPGDKMAKMPERVATCCIVLHCVA
jgi:hypothetical protein